MKTNPKGKKNVPFTGKGILKPSREKAPRPSASSKSFAQIMSDISGASKTPAEPQLTNGEEDLSETDTPKKQKMVKFSETPVSLETGEPYTRPPRPPGDVRPPGDFRSSKTPASSSSKATCFRLPMSSRRRRRPVFF